MTRTTVAVAAALFACAGAAQAEIKTQTVDYRAGDTVLEGFIAWDDAKSGKMPGVVVFPQWTGPSDHERNAATELAKLGYVAMVADVYGKGIRPAQGKEAGAEAGKYMKDRPLLRARVKAGFDRLMADPHVDAARMAAIGYCFGGTAALELGREGADLKALVTFHGTLSNPTPADARNIKATVLVLHGADDPAVPPAEVEAFRHEMKEAKTDFEFVAYSGTVHSFTQPGAGNDNAKGAAYNERSAKRAWMAMRDLFNEKLGP